MSLFSKQIKSLRLRRNRLKASLKKYLIKALDRSFPFFRNSLNHEIKAEMLVGVSKSAYIISPSETLKEIQTMISTEQAGVYMRFGDGDVNLLKGLDDLMQIHDTNLMNEMREAFQLKGRGVFKALMIHSENYGYEKEMFFGNHLVKDDDANHLLQDVIEYFVGYKIYSHIALHYIATYKPSEANLFLKILKNKAVLFIGNQETEIAIINRLFGNVRHIKTPAINSYLEIDRIEEEALSELKKIRHYGVVIVAMGCSGRALMKRLYGNDFNVYYFDFGSLLDGICGNMSRTWLKKTSIDYEALLKDL